MRRFGAEVDGACGVFRNALEGFEHKVEFTYAREFALTANGAGYFMLGNVILELFVSPARDIFVDAFFVHIVFDERVGAVTGFAVLAVDERVGKASEVTARFPDSGIHENGAIQSHVIRTFRHEFFPPRGFDVIFERYAERTEIPGVGESAVYFAAAENKAPAFA